MSEVYEARHARLPGGFAVKVLTGEAEPGSVALERFRREAEIVASLRHPNIVQVIDFNQTEDGVPYMVMELLEGADLATELARGGRMPLSRVLGIVEQSASALAAAHGRDVVHRDLKPQNLFLVPAGPGRDLVKVLDFGISKVRTAPTLTGDGSLLGTPQYMAPEQIRGQPEDVDGRTDQFALAAIAYEALAGRPAFGADSSPAAMDRVMNLEPPPIDGVPEPVNTVLRRGLAKRREERFVSVQELAQALTTAAAGHVPAAARADAPTLVPAGQRREPRRAVALVLALATIAAIATFLATRPSARAPEAVAPPAAVPSAPPSAASLTPTPPPAPASPPVQPPTEALATRKRPPRANRIAPAAAPPVAAPAPTPPAEAARPPSRGNFIKDL
jgi:serine/threonine-protein kinase